MASTPSQDAASQQSEHRSDDSSSSSRTLGHHAADGHHEERDKHPNGERSDNDEEKGDHSSPLQPVGFFSKSLSKVRMQVFALWARTSLSYVNR